MSMKCKPEVTMDHSFHPEILVDHPHPVRVPDWGPPGVVIGHSPASSGIFLGSPSLVSLGEGQYLVSYDEFGAASQQDGLAVTHICRSEDNGASWREIALLQGAFWSTLFSHRGALYLLGTDRQYGRVVIRRSRDEGHSWTQPIDEESGVLRADGTFHCAPVPVVEHKGRLWRAMEEMSRPSRWPAGFAAFMMSAPVEADLLLASSWVSSNPLQRDSNWAHGEFNGWLEGNAVIDPQGQVVNVLRVDKHQPHELAAMVRYSADGGTASFHPDEDIFPFPGGSKKFTIRHDAVSGLYWSLTNAIPPRYAEGNPNFVRNTLALICSPDLRDWTVRHLLLQHPDTARHGYQYVDWLFDGADIVYVVRTACEDESGGALNFHDSNFITWHRATHFRD